jgi:aminopeptidase N
MAITAPDTLTSVANGPLESVVTVPGGKKKYVYSSNYPVSTYLVAFASSVYNAWST